jgi:predicted Zn finger-like uncharacterized protein
MAEVIQCPSCHKKLRVPENLLGKNVKCPACSTMFVAEAGEEDLPIAPVIEERPPSSPQRRRPPVEEEYEEDRPRRRKPEAPPPEEDDYDEEPEDEFEEEEPRPRRRRRRRRGAPHRGSTILVLGILSFFCLTPIFGPMAWVMGSNDLKEMRAGRMDREGEGLTNAGRICGIISTCLCIAGFCIYGLVFIAALSGARH